MIVFKTLKSLNLLYILVLTSFIWSCTSYSKGHSMPEFIYPLNLSLNMTSELMYNKNEEYLDYKSADYQPANTVFEGFNFPSGSKVKSLFSYLNGTIEISNISSVNAMGDSSIKNDPLPEITIVTFLRGDNPKNITDKEVYEQVQNIFKQLELEGWVFNLDINAPRLTPENAVIYAIAGGDASYLDFRYPLDFDEFNQITSYIHRWYLRHGTDTFLEIEMWRNVEENGGTTVLLAYKFHDELREIYRFVEVEDQPKALDAFANLYNNYPFTARLGDESKVVDKNISLDKTLTSHTFPLVLKNTGFDTAKQLNTDPYKLTYDQFLEKEEAGKDVTPYLEEQPTPEITSQAKGRCLPNQPCPKSGYWFTQAKADSRAYFKQGDIMPDYPNNNWGEVIWQFDSEKS